MNRWLSRSAKNVDQLFNGARKSVEIHVPVTRSMSSHRFTRLVYMEPRAALQGVG